MSDHRVLRSSLKHLLRDCWRLVKAHPFWFGHPIGLIFWFGLLTRAERDAMVEEALRAPRPEEISDGQ